MARKEVMDAVKARLDANWSTAPVAYPNDATFTAPEDGSPYLRVEYPIARESQISVGAPGANVWRENGVFRVVINAVRGAGLDDASAWAKTLAALFRGKDFDGVQTFGASEAETDDENENGKYYTIAVAVEFEHDLFG